MSRYRDPDTMAQGGWARQHIRSIWRSSPLAQAATSHQCRYRPGQDMVQLFVQGSSTQGDGLERAQLWSDCLFFSQRTTPFILADHQLKEVSEFPVGHGGLPKKRNPHSPVHQEIVVMQSIFANAQMKAGECSHTVMRLLFGKSIA
jgi:hypothetical protein